MATHPMVLLVEPDPVIRQLIHGELKDEGYIVVDTCDSDEALAFAELYPGAIDLAVTDLDKPEDEGPRFVDALRSLPTGTDTKVSRLPSPFDRAVLLKTVREALPSHAASRAVMQSQAEDGDRAVFWGAQARLSEGVSLH